MVENYLGKRKTISQMAVEHGCSYDVIRRRLREHGLELLGRRRSSKGKHNHRSSMEFKNFKHDVFWAYGGRCAICAYDKFVNAHHLVRWADSGDNSLANGILLCPNHHAEADMAILEVEELRKYQVSKT